VVALEAAAEEAQPAAAIRLGTDVLPGGSFRLDLGTHRCFLGRRRRRDEPRKRMFGLME
jgi:hypothetical protein